MSTKIGSASLLIDIDWSFRKRIILLHVPAVLPMLNCFKYESPRFCRARARPSRKLDTLMTSESSSSLRRTFGRSAAWRVDPNNTTNRRSLSARNLPLDNGVRQYGQADNVTVQGLPCRPLSLAYSLRLFTRTGANANWSPWRPGSGLKTLPQSVTMWRSQADRMKARQRLPATALWTANMANQSVLYECSTRNKSRIDRTSLNALLFSYLIRMNLSCDQPLETSVGRRSPIGCFHSILNPH